MRATLAFNGLNVIYYKTSGKQSELFKINFELCHVFETHHMIKLTIQTQRRRNYLLHISYLFLFFGRIKLNFFSLNN